MPSAGGRYVAVGRTGGPRTDQPDGHRGKPHTVVSDNGTEFTSSAILRWAQERRVEWHYIVPGKPMQNGFVESFNGCLRDECLNETLFASLIHARFVLLPEARLQDEGPYSKLGGKWGRLRIGFPHGHRKTTTQFAGLRMIGMVAPMMLDGPINGDWFEAYGRKALVAELRPATSSSWTTFRATSGHP